MIKIAVSGILGQMGQVLHKEILKDDEIIYAGGYDITKAPGIVNDLNHLKSVDILIDFSSPKALKNILEYAKKNNVGLVLATTGHTEEDFKLMSSYSKDIAIFYTPNYSVGIHLLSKALKLVSQHIDASYDIEMIDKHHRFKKDAPSGTAFKLYDAINSGLKDKKDLIEGTSDKLGIHVHSLRLGSYVGEHQVIFSNLSETLEFSHIAHDKSVFAQGALKAAKFINNKENGLYNMDDLLGGI